ncbi:MAG: Rab family GTPase [Promethearchaeota archaeon]
MKIPYMFKIVNSGDAGVGKTAFLKRYTTGEFIEESIETIGTGFFTKTLYLGLEHEKIDLTIWDLGGQDRFRHIVKGFVMGAAGALLFFDLTRYETFKHLDEWVHILRYGEGDEVLDENLPILLLGNKSDLKDLIEIKQSEIDDYVKKQNLVGYFQTSAKTGENVNESVEMLVKYIYETDKGI